MRRSFALLVPVLLLAACGGQEAAPTVEATLSAPLPMDATATTDSALLPIDASPTFEIVLQPTDATSTDSVLLPMDSTATSEVAMLVTDANTTPTSDPMLLVEATATLGLQPGANFDATPTPEALMSQSAPVDAQASLGPDTISADVWRSTQLITDGQDTSSTDVVGNTLTVFQPTGWSVFDDTETLVLANYDDAANSTASLTDTQIAVSVFAIPNDLAPLSVAEGFEPSCPLIVANFLTLTDDLPNAEWGQILLTSSDNQDGAIVNGTNGDDDALIACVQLETGYGMVIATSEQGRMNDALPFIVTVTRSVAYGS